VDINPRAPILTAIEGQVAPEELLGELTDEPPPRPALSRFMADSAHARRFATAALRPNGPVPFKRLADWLGELVAARGEHLLRVKGIVAVEGQTRPVAVHGVQHVFHPPRLLDHWPARVTEPVIVFVLDGIDPSVIHQSAADAGLISKGAGGYEPRSG
jgi:G3E family GTPase